MHDHHSRNFARRRVSGKAQFSRDWFVEGDLLLVDLAESGMPVGRHEIDPPAIGGREAASDLLRLHREIRYKHRQQTQERGTPNRAQKI